MKKLRWQILLVVLAVVLIAILLLEQQQPVTTSTAPVASEQPVSGGMYHEALIGSFGRLNPALDYYNSSDRDIDSLLFRGLIRFDDSGLPRADMAESWGISQDARIYNFSIRQNAVWHDGTPVTSTDVIFTLDLMLSEEIPIPEDLRSFWEEIEVIPLDERTIQFRLPEPFAPFLDFLSFGLLPEHLLGDLSPQELIDDDFNLEPVGNGPYRFSELITEQGEIQGVVLSAFEDFYAGAPFIDEVIFTYFTEQEAALQAYLAGEVMGIGQVSEDVLMQALDEPGLNIYTGRLPELTLVYFNLDDPRLTFFQEPDIRKALLLGLNRRRIVDRVLNGQAIVANSPIFPGTWAYYPDLETVEYDPDQALEIIREAGYTIPTGGGNVRQKEGVELAFELVYPDTDLHAEIAEIIRENWRMLGVDVSTRAIPYEQLVTEYLEPRDYEAALVDLSFSRSPDPDPYPFWDQAQISNGQNYAGWDDRQASEYIERARIDVDYRERAREYRNFQVRFAQELPALPLFYPVYSYAVSAELQGVSMGPLFDPSGRLATLPSWYLETERLSGPPAPPTSTP